MDNTYVHSENMTFIYFEAEDGAEALHEHKHPQRGSVECNAR